MADTVFVLTLLVALAAVLFAVYVLARLVWKTGFHRWWLVPALMLPYVNLVVLVVLAFVEWPVERELREAQEENAELRDRLRAAARARV